MNSKTGSQEVEPYGVVPRFPSHISCATSPRSAEHARNASHLTVDRAEFLSLKTGFRDEGPPRAS